MQGFLSLCHSYLCLDAPGEPASTRQLPVSGLGEKIAEGAAQCRLALKFNKM